MFLSIKYTIVGHIVPWPPGLRLELASLNIPKVLQDNITFAHRVPDIQSHKT